jgi:hypothetical protein
MTIEQAQRQITSCESCNPAGAELLFSSILDELMGTDAQFTDYILEVRARCPHCGATVAENTVVACE